MPCYSPIRGYRSRFVGPSGKRAIVFNRSDGFADMVVELPCGQCIGCRTDKSRMWALRCTHEAKMHEVSIFVTLTYDDEHLPEDLSLDKKHLQDFFKRLRKNAPFRYFACGEYGEAGGRPHYHAILFGIDFSDKKQVRKNKQGNALYTSETLSKIWGHGYVTIGAFSYTTAAYIARYCIKKVTGKDANEHYTRTNLNTGEIWPISHPFLVMSLKPGIGKTWYQKFHKDVFPSDFLVHDGKKHSVPPYYTKLLEKVSESAVKQIKQKRKKGMFEHAHDSTPDRLYDREVVKQSRIKPTEKGTLKFMIKKIYAVFDFKSGIFGNPFISVNDGTAIRSFCAAALDSTSEISKFPVDYALFTLGSYDDETGIFKQDPKEIELIGSAYQLLQRLKQTEENKP